MMKQMGVFFVLLGTASCNEGGIGAGSVVSEGTDVSSPVTANLQLFHIVPQSDGLDLASQAGADGVRATPNLGWHDVEPTLGGAYSWDIADMALQLVQSHGLEYFRILNSSRPEYNPTKGTPLYGKYKYYSYLLPVELWPQYQTFVGAVVRRYYKTKADGNPDAPDWLTRPIKNWSYTPEIATYWVPGTDPAQMASDYGQMFKLTYEAMHAADPNAKLFLPFNGFVYLAAFVDGFLPRETIYYHGEKNGQGSTQLSRADVASLNANQITFVKSLIQDVGGALQSQGPDVYDFHLYGDAESIPGQKAWLEWYLTTAKLPKKLVYSMEGGEPYGGLGESFPQGPGLCPGYPVQEDPSRLAFQSSAMVRHFVLAFSNGFRSVTFSQDSEYGTDGNDFWFGDLDLRNACGTPRPAYYTFKLAKEKLVPFTTATEIAAMPADVRLFRFTFPASKADVWVAWDPTLTGNGTQKHDVSLSLGFPKAKVTHAVTIAGQTEPKAYSEATSALFFGATPVFVEAEPTIGPPPPIIVEEP